MFIKTQGQIYLTFTFTISNNFLGESDTSNIKIKVLQCCVVIDLKEMCHTFKTVLCKM